MRRLALGKVKQYRLGSWSVSGNSLFSGDNNIPLGNLPVKNEAGVGMLVALEYKLDVTFATLTSDPTVPSYMLDGFFGTKLVSNDGKEWINWMGYDAPIREFDRQGWLRGNPIALDLPATGGGGPGSYSRSIVRRYEFIRPELGALAHINLLPTRYFATSGYFYLDLRGVGSARFYNGATVTITAATLTLTAYVADWLDLANFPVACFIRERFRRGDVDQQPTANEGAFYRWHMAIDPAGDNAGDSTPPADDLSSITRVRLGVANGIPLYDRYVTEMVRKYMLGSRDDRDALATPATYQEQYRFADNTTNASGRLHYLPILTPPKQGAKMADVYDFGTNKPRVVVNNDDRTGTPDSFDHILTEFASRDDDMVIAILGSIGAQSRFKGSQQAHATVVGGQATKVPLVVAI